MKIHSVGHLRVKNDVNICVNIVQKVFARKSAFDPILNVLFGDSNLAIFFKWSQIEKKSEINPPLVLTKENCACKRREEK